MDAYYLSREDWDTLVELGVDHHQEAVVLKKIAASTKTAFTKKYVVCVCVRAVSLERVCVPGTMRPIIRSRIIRRWMGSRRPRSSRAGLRRTLKKPWTYVSCCVCVRAC